VVRAIVVLRDGTPSDELARQLQEHCKRQTAPYKFPRIVEFADELPKTASGKIKRAELRDRVPGRLDWPANQSRRTDDD
jgi:acyl-coenzyme A synthetase/AMP-(fatty) acid ligase